MRTSPVAASRVLALVFVALASTRGLAQDLPRGEIIDEVASVADQAQRYALYLPSTFTPSRTWPIILAFDAGGRGRRAVERYRPAAERFGFIVAGSNNSRNGPWKPSLDAGRAMLADLTGRFPIDRTRVYTAGMSGGARVALMVALHPDLVAGSTPLEIAGVLASSAGFPQGERRKLVGFPVFGTVGTEDFNYREMTELDRLLESRHRVVVFEGGHTWLPEWLATEAIAWMELQRMAEGKRPRDQALIDEQFETRTAQASGIANRLAAMREWQSIARDFKGLKKVEALEERAEALGAQPEVKAALETERADAARETEMIAEVAGLLEDVDTPSGLAKLQAHAAALLERARAADDSSSRRMARRVLTSLRASGVRSPELKALFDQVPVTATR